MPLQLADDKIMLSNGRSFTGTYKLYFFTEEPNKLWMRVKVHLNSV